MSMRELAEALDSEDLTKIKAALNTFQGFSDAVSDLVDALKGFVEEAEKDPENVDFNSDKFAMLLGKIVIHAQRLSKVEDELS